MHQHTVYFVVVCQCDLVIAAKSLKCDFDDSTAIVFLIVDCSDSYVIDTQTD